MWHCAVIGKVWGFNVVNLIQKYFRTRCGVLKKFQPRRAHNKQMIRPSKPFVQPGKRRGSSLAASAFSHPGFHVCRSHRRTFERRLQRFCHRHEDFWIVFFRLCQKIEKCKAEAHHHGHVMKCVDLLHWIFLKGHEYRTLLDAWLCNVYCCCRLIQIVLSTHSSFPFRMFSRFLLLVQEGKGDSPN